MRRSWSAASRVLIKVNMQEVNEMINMLKSKRGMLPDARRAQATPPRRNDWLTKPRTGLIGRGASGVSAAVRLVRIRNR